MKEIERNETHAIKWNKLCSANTYTQWHDSLFSYAIKREWVHQIFSEAAIGSVL